MRPALRAGARWFSSAIDAPNAVPLAVSGAISLFDYRDVMEPPPDYLAMATEFGAVAAVQKPFQPRELLRAVRESIGIKV